MNCNLRCKHCCFSCQPMKNPSFISVKNFNKILNKLVKGGVIKISLNGGEVTTHPFLKEILREIYNTGIAWSLATNGTLLKEELIKIFYKYEPTSITVSLDGPDKETHEFIRGKNTFDKTVGAILLLRKYNINVHINTLLHKGVSKSKLIKLASFCLDNDLKLGFIGLYPKGRALKHWKELALSDKEFYEFYKFITENKIILDAQKGNETMSEIISLVPNNTCAAARSFFCIDEHGYTYPCDLFINTDFIGPNLLDNDVTVEQVWYSPKFTLIRRILIDIVGCIFSPICYRRKIGKCKPCPALAYSNYRNLYMPDPRCLFYPKTLGYIVKGLTIDDENVNN